jgi:type II secretory pathway component PulF
MKRDADGWKHNRSSRRLDLLPLVHPLRLYLDAGMGLPEALRRLTTRLPSPLRPFVQALAEETGRGESLADALKPWKVALPPVVTALLVAGEVAGNLPEILRRIEIHLQAEARSRKHLISVLTWPVLQALLAMGLLLLVGLIQSMLGAGRATPGFGWSSFFPFLIVVGVALATAWNYRRLPGIANALVLIARAHLGSILGLALDSGLTPRKAIDLAATASGHPPWLAALAEARKRLRDGAAWREVFADWPDLGPDFLVSLENGEITGQLPECLTRQATIDRDQGERLMAHALQVVASLAWLLSAGAIVFTIIRFYMSYISLLTVN